MRKRLLLLALAMVILTYLPAQSSQMLLKRLAETVKQDNTDEALQLFRQLKSTSLRQAVEFCLQHAKGGGNLQRALETEVIDAYKLRCDYVDAYAFCRKLLGFLLVFRLAYRSLATWFCTRLYTALKI